VPVSGFEDCALYALKCLSNTLAFKYVGVGRGNKELKENHDHNPENPLIYRRL
jgi:hypothetical protein